MAPLPKRRHSTARQGKRRNALSLPSVPKFSKLTDGTIKLSHRIAPDGTYGGKQIVPPKRSNKK